MPVCGPRLMAICAAATYATKNQFTPSLLLQSGLADSDAVDSSPTGAQEQDHAAGKQSHVL
jgi:hypothetical protein